MTKVTLFCLIMALFVSYFCAAEQPPYSIKDTFINENFQEAYRLIDIHRHEGNDSTSLNLFISSDAKNQIDLYKIIVGSSTLAANSSVVVTSPTATSILFAMMTQMDSSSQTCSISQWNSSFTLTNDGATAKKVHWWLFGRTP